MLTRPAVILLAGLLAGCATEALAPSPPVPSVTAAISAVTAAAPSVAAPAPAVAAAPDPTGLVSPFKVLADLLDKIGNNRLLSAVNNDADKTLAWIDSMQATTPPTLSPLSEFQARACPTAVKLATEDLQQKIELLKGVLAQVDAQVSGFDPTEPAIIFFFTRLRYSPAAGGLAGLDPKAAIAQLKSDVAGRVTAVIDSCRQIVPLKQIDELNKLLIKGGMLGISGGAAAPFLGLIP